MEITQFDRPHKGRNIYSNVYDTYHWVLMSVTPLAHTLNRCWLQQQISSVTRRFICFPTLLTRDRWRLLITCMRWRGVFH